LHGNVIDADLLTDRRHAAEKLPDDGLADQAHLRRGADVSVGERLSCGQVRPVADFQILRGRVPRTFQGDQLRLP